MKIDFAEAEIFMREQRLHDPFGFAFAMLPTRRVFIAALAQPGQTARQIGATRTGVRARRIARPASDIPAVR
jgi:hypothetical protein